MREPSEPKPVLAIKKKMQQLDLSSACSNNTSPPAEERHALNTYSPVSIISRSSALLADSLPSSASTSMERFGDHHIHSQQGQDNNNNNNKPSSLSSSSSSSSSSFSHQRRSNVTPHSTPQVHVIAQELLMQNHNEQIVPAHCHRLSFLLHDDENDGTQARDLYPASTGVNKKVQETEVLEEAPELVIHGLLKQVMTGHATTWQPVQSKSEGVISGSSTTIMRGFPSPGTPSRSSFSGTSSCGQAAVPSYNGYRPYNLRAGRMTPSKWEDAEKWLVNPKYSMHSPPSPQQMMQEKHFPAINNSEILARQFALDAQAASDSEVTSRQEYSNEHHYLLTRSTSHKCDFTESLSSTSYRRSLVMARPAKELPEPSRLSQEDTVYNMSRVVTHKYAVQNRGFRNQWEAIPQDKYADTVIEKEKEEVVVQTPLHGRTASMIDAATEISPSVSRRDMGTQITPFDSSCTSPVPMPIAQKNSCGVGSSPPRHNTPVCRSYSWSSTTVAACDHHHGTDSKCLELDTCNLEKLELRDVPVLESSAQPDWKNNPRLELEEEMGNISDGLAIVKKSSIEARASIWMEAELAKFAARFKREEARIEAWENLQKAKAEAELKKLEVKLEKWRAQATEKMKNRVAAARKRAEEMRAAAEAHQNEQTGKIRERTAHFTKTGRFPSPTFTLCFARPSSTSPT